MPGKTIRVDNGPEFISKTLYRWAEQPKVPAMRSIVGKAAEGYENGVTARASASDRNQWLFSVIARDYTSRRWPLHDSTPALSVGLPAREKSSKIEAWRRDYNESRPHTPVAG
jgi:putative transposase